MLKNSTWKLEDTNLANFGSKLDLDHHKQEGALETAWNSPGSPVGKQTGLWIWRIEDFKLVAVPDRQYGKFYQGDSYVILRSVTKGKSDKLVHHIHFWLGLETSQDEAGTAAYKTVELDDFLGTSPVQHREVQSQESQLFLSYFPRIVYLKGGVASGFHHNDEHEPVTRLLQIHRPQSLAGTHTRNAVVFIEVPLHSDSLNSGDVFVLDTGDKIYQWQGKESKGIEKAKAAEFIAQLISERDGKGQSIIVEEQSGAHGGFWDALGSHGPIKSANQGEANAEQKIQRGAGQKRLFRLIQEDDGNVQFQEVEPRQSTFDSKHVFIFDVGHQVYTWVGNETTAKDRVDGLHYAQLYVQHSELPAFTPITRIVQGGEDELFESSLEGWQG
ncbi:hypothetical protein INT43_003590, partial [Umbelopsis isabellina]